MVRREPLCADDVGLCFLLLADLVSVGVGLLDLPQADDAVLGVVQEDDGFGLAQGQERGVGYFRPSAQADLRRRATAGDRPVVRLPSLP